MKSEAWIHNEKQLSIINRTLQRDKIGIFLNTGAGDILTAMSVLQYKEELWGNADIIWYCNMPNADLFKYSLVSEVRPYPWEGIEVDPFTQLCKNNRLDQIRKGEFEITADLKDGYFPAPWHMTLEQRSGIDFPDISKRIFSVHDLLPWHPVIGFSTEEYAMISEFCESLPFSKTIMLETDFNSIQSGWNDELTLRTMAICRDKLGDCNFIFGSNRDNSRFFDKGVVSCKDFTLRQTSLVIDHCDLFIGVASGVSVTISRLGAKPVPVIQYCNSQQCSTKAMANGPFVLVCPSDEISALPPEAKNKELHTIFEKQLNLILETI